MTVEIEVNSADREQHGETAAGSCEEPTVIEAELQLDQADGTFESVAPLRTSGGCLTLEQLLTGDFVVVVVDAEVPSGADPDTTTSVLLDDPVVSRTFYPVACGQIPSA